MLLDLVHAGPTDPPSRNPDLDDDVATRTVPRAKTPRRFKVIFHNDDYTTMEFVILVLRSYFHKNDAEANHIMMTVHRKGRAVAGIYPRDVAETKVSEVMDLAKENGMPLLLTTEPEDGDGSGSE